MKEMVNNWEKQKFVEVKLEREEKNSLYTEGQLQVNDITVAQTLEATTRMLPPGNYLIYLTKDKKRRRVIGIWLERGDNLPPFYTGFSISLGHSWINCRKEHSVCIGRLLVPGALFRGRTMYERLFDRIEKWQKRKKTIRLTISDKHCRPSEPLRHWVKDHTKLYQSMFV